MGQLTLDDIYARCTQDGLGDDACLLWGLSCSSAGYPRISGGYAHVKAWECAHGKIRRGLFVRRTCEQVRCCNVKHMELMTRGRQNRMAAAKGAWKGADRVARLVATKRARSRIPQEVVEAIKLSKESGVVLAARYEISRSMVSLIRLGKSRGAVKALPCSVFHLHV